MSVQPSLISASSAAKQERFVRDSLAGSRTLDEPNVTAVFTLVLWFVCLSVGLLGFVLHYERPRPLKAPEEPVIAQQLQVELAQEPQPPPDAEPQPLDPLAPPPPPDAFTPPAVAQPIAVASFTPAVAFALPVAGPSRVVEVNRAEYARRPATNTPAPAATTPTAQPLTFGEGEGKQPAPDYPPLAKQRGQEGTVVVRLTVDENGQVRRAEAALPSPWPLLNEAALKVVRERWHFRTGSARVYEVAVRFELTK